VESRFSSPIAESLMESVGPVLLGLGGRGRGGEGGCQIEPLSVNNAFSFS